MPPRQMPPKAAPPKAAALRRAATLDNPVALDPGNASHFERVQLAIEKIEAHPVMDLVYPNRSFWPIHCFKTP